MNVFKEFELPSNPKIPNSTFNIRDFGAVADGKTLNTSSIARAIDSCQKEGGGKIIFPKGVWHTGAIHLKDNIQLHFCEGAEVLFSRDFSDYLPVVFSQLGGIRCYNYSSMIYGRGLTNIAITGSGTLNGQGEVWWPWKHHQKGMVDLFLAGSTRRPIEDRVYGTPEDGARPRFLQFIECKNVLIEGVTFQNSPSWTVHPVWCENLIVRGIKITNPMDSHNTDGINLESCKSALVEECTVESGGDDVICLKAGRDEDAWDVGMPCENIVIRKCRAIHCKGGGIVIGSETSAGIKNALIHDCEFYKTSRGIRMKTMKGRGGYVENLEFRNIKIGRVNDAINLTYRYAGEPLDDKSKPIANMPVFRNISFSDITCEYAKNGIVLEGIKDYNIENIYFTDIDIKAEKGIRADCFKNITMKNVSIT